MSGMEESEELRQFLHTITLVEKKREFDRQVDRLKKSSSATTVWAIIPGLLGFYGIAHFYLNRPIEGLIIFLLGLIPSLLLYVSIMINFLPSDLLLSYLPIPPQYLTLLPLAAVGFHIVFLFVNVILARYHYSRYDFFIHVKAKKPWNNWGLQSQI